MGNKKARTIESGKKTTRPCPRLRTNKKKGVLLLLLVFYCRPGRAFYSRHHGSNPKTDVDLPSSCPLNQRPTAHCTPTHPPLYLSRLQDRQNTEGGISRGQTQIFSEHGQAKSYLLCLSTASAPTAALLLHPYIDTTTTHCISTAGRQA